MSPRIRSVAAIAISSFVLLSACTSEQSPSSSSPTSSPNSNHNTTNNTSQEAHSMTPTHEQNQAHGSQENDQQSSSHGHMEHPMDGGPAPENIKKASNPTYSIGETVRLTADHMEGMKGAKAKIVGVFNTHTYAVNYTAPDGTEIRDHKWVVQEEIEDAGTQLLAPGTQVRLSADHMEGMKGAEATISSSTDETVYMVDYETDGMTMKNHKWVVESEIEPA